MVEAAVGATIQVLIENLLTMSQEQINLVRHIKNDLKKLQNTFSMVDDFLLDAEEKQVNDTVVKRWLKELEALAFEADNVFDEIEYHLLSKKVKPTQNKTVKKKVKSFFSCSNNYRLKLGRRIKDINEKLKSINQQASEFGLQNRITSVHAPFSRSDASGSTETDSFSVDPVILGRENDVSTIVKMLITTPSPSEQLSILPIVGMGGLGKTTLAREVFGDEQIISHFGDNRVWVHVSRNFDVVVLLKNILTSLTTENVEHGNKEAILKRLQNSLGTKKYLLVLDDIWNEDREKWDDFVKSLSGISFATGNCMLVTTRSQEVVSIVKTLRIHELESLSEDDCWLIIKAKYFNRSGDNIPSEFETMRRNIAEKCQGLPLAAKVVGGFLFGKSIYEWMSIEKNWFSDFGDVNPISKILKLSFDNLASPSLKKCFAFCSIFPKGYEIKKKQLVELWMAEGFLQTNDHRRSNINMETTGNKYFNLLLQNSLLQVERRDGTISMHDLVHDLACSVLGENDNVTDFINQTRYIGYKSNGDELFFIPKGQERFVRTLFFNGKISDIRFSNFESLHALTLRGDDTDDLPTSIRHLKHLRYLDVSETKIKYLPVSIGELYHLQTLRAEVNKMERLPNSLSNLISLRHLHNSRSTQLPPEIGRLTSLRTLPYFCVRDEKGCEISELGNLKDLEGELGIYNLEKVHDKNEAMGADLLRKSGIHDLTLAWNESREDDEVNDESVLEGLQPHPNLKSLLIRRFKGKNLPLWTSKMAVQLDGRCLERLNNLMEITIEDCSECEELPMLGHLPHLKSICLEDLENVRSIGSSFYNIKDCSKSRRASNNGVWGRAILGVFCALKSLNLSRMPNLTEWAEVDFPSANEGDQTQLYEVVVFPCLKYLTVHNCKKLVRAPSRFPCLKKLDIFDMESSLPLENICRMKLTSLKIVRIWRIEGLECLPHGLFSNSHNLIELDIRDCQNMTCLVPCLRGGGASLTMLRINDCPKLRELPDDLHILSSLEEFRISRCPSLKSIPYRLKGDGGGQQQGFTSLSDLDITDCKGLTSLPIEMIESCAPSLEELRLEGLTNFPMVIGCVHKMPRLTKLIICEIPKFSKKDIGSISTNNSLQHFQIGPSLSSSWENVSFNEAVDAMLLQFISLRRLTLIGMEHWVCLPDQLQHLTSLSSLWLSGFGIEALPEWLGNLSSLEALNVDDCKKLRHLPTKQAMLCLSKLTSLWIYDCPLILKEGRRDNNNNSNSNKKIDGPQMVDSEYSKISHIPSIKTHGGFWQYDQ